MSSCYTEEKLLAYLERDMAGRELRRMEGHVDECPACREKLVEVEGLLAFFEERLTLAEAKPPSPLPEPDLDDLLRRVKARKRAFYRKAAGRLAYAAAAVVVVLLILFPVPGDPVGNVSVAPQYIIEYFRLGRHIELLPEDVPPELRLELKKDLELFDGWLLNTSPSFQEASHEEAVRLLGDSYHFIDDPSLSEGYDLYVSQSYTRTMPLEDAEKLERVKLSIGRSILSDYGRNLEKGGTLLLCQARRDHARFYYKNGETRSFPFPHQLPNLGGRTVTGHLLQPFHMVVPTLRFFPEEDLELRFQFLRPVARGTPVFLEGKQARLYKGRKKILIWAEGGYLFSMTSDLSDRDLFDYAEKVKKTQDHPPARTR